MNAMLTYDRSKCLEAGKINSEVVRGDRTILTTAYVDGRIFCCINGCFYDSL